LTIIEEETDRLNEIVTRILTPAKKPSFEYFNLHESLQRVLALSNAESQDNLTINRDLTQVFLRFTEIKIYSYRL
jgi:two-component system nitrogen regulation sensor histidine kinase GlnL